MPDCDATASSVAAIFSNTGPLSIIRSKRRSRWYSASVTGSMARICARPVSRRLASDLFMNWQETPTRVADKRCTMLTHVTFGSPATEQVAK
jgi:hypothetical protein